MLRGLKFFSVFFLLIAFSHSAVAEESKKSLDLAIGISGASPSFGFGVENCIDTFGTVAFSLVTSLFLDGYL